MRVLWIERPPTFLRGWVFYLPVSWKPFQLSVYGELVILSLRDSAPGRFLPELVILRRSQGRQRRREHLARGSKTGIRAFASGFDATILQGPCCPLTLLCRSGRGLHPRRVFRTWH